MDSIHTGVTKQRYTLKYAVEHALLKHDHDLSGLTEHFSVFFTVCQYCILIMT